MKLRYRIARWISGDKDDPLSDGAIVAIRELLKVHGVPEAAFIDDHVANAIVQRNQARAFIEGLDCECDPAYSTRICGACAIKKTWATTSPKAEKDDGAPGYKPTALGHTSAKEWNKANPAPIPDKKP